LIHHYWGAQVSDIKLFRLAAGQVQELAGESVQVEKSLQNIFEKSLEALVGVRFLASEYSTGPVHGGRIDTLGLDEDDCPVIIEYKRAVNENVVNQGLFYLDWLLDHRKEFQWLVMEKLGADTAKEVDWSAPRLLCIAGDFTRYDAHAVKQIARNIELLRYRRFSDDLIMLELIHAPRQLKVVPSVPTSSPESPGTIVVAGPDPYLSQRISYRIAQSPQELLDIFDAVRQYLSGLGDDVQVKELQNYIAFKRIKNFACLEVYPQARVVTVYLKVDPKSVSLESNFTRDVSEIGHFGTGDLQVSLRSMEDFTKAQQLFLRSYQES
jgi:predicted transport protein